MRPHDVSNGPCAKVVAAIENCREEKIYCFGWNFCSVLPRVFFHMNPLFIIKLDQNNAEIQADNMQKWLKKRSSEVGNAVCLRWPLWQCLLIIGSICQYCHSSHSSSQCFLKNIDNLTMCCCKYGSWIISFSKLQVQNSVNVAALAPSTQ